MVRSNHAHGKKYNLARKDYLTIAEAAPRTSAPSFNESSLAVGCPSAGVQKLEAKLPGDSQKGML